MEIEAESLGECMRIAQALLRLDLEKSPRLWIVTKGAQGPGLSNVSHSTLWGFGRSLAAEHSEMRVVRMDMDPARDATAEELLRCMRMARTEDELALRGRETYVPRLRHLTRDVFNLKPAASGQESNLRLELKEAGTLEGIESVVVSRHAPGPGEVEIQVHAAGLNFRDVLSVLGMYKGRPGPLGGECAGTIVRVGRGVKSLRPGDEVVALGQGCFATFLTTPADLVWSKPANLSFEAAVTIPIAFLTAWYALKSIADIQPGERVLIHAGAGGVGLAAIQIAQNAGAIVFATAGSQEKRAYLQSIGVRHVMDSRSLDFAREIREVTEGQGVDVVLNSLVGPFIDAGLEILSPRGRFVELGVADIRSAESVARLRPDITYHPFNLAPALEARDSFIHEILTTIIEQFQSGVLRPLPQEIFSMEKARDAFRYMAQARHIGRVVICPSKDAGNNSLRKDGAYLVAGGLSGVGLAVVQWLARRGVAQVIVMGRRPATDEAMEIFNSMRDAGVIVSLSQGDVTKEADVQSALDHAKSFPLRGVFHCAAVLDDGVLLQQDWSRFQRVLSPKLEGAYNLHRLTADSPLDHFVLFSSMASVFGSPGQTNYAAANAFLDAMAHYRRSRGLPALSINWGPWSETGAAVRHGVVERGSKIGIGGISTEDGLHALEMLLADTHAQVMVAPLDAKAYFAGDRAESVQPLLRGLRTSRQDNAPTVASQKKQPSWLPQLQAAATAKRRDLLMRLLEERIKSTLGLNQAQEIDPTQPLQELGLDSLLAIELRNALSTCLNRSLPATLLFNYPTLNALTGFILRDVLADAATGTKRPTAAGKVEDTPADLIADIEALSDEEVARLLSARATERAQ
jgi:NADPH:quinone reductase-like Zn-dependent oxidoreductase/acyl carrier protein